MNWKIINHQSSGNCEKYLIQVFSGHIIEVAAIKHNGLLHLCMPTQIGCAVHCKHCATTYSRCPFVDNLSYSELSSITEYFVKKYSSEKIALSFSAHGEPLLNWQCISAIAEENQNKVYSIFVTTIGIVHILDEIIQSKKRFTVLYFSVHGTNDNQRALLIPENTNFAKLKKIIEFTNEYVTSGGYVVWNYMVHNKNCSEQDALALISLLRNIKVNISLRLTPYVAITSEVDYNPSIMPASETEFSNFVDTLSNYYEEVPTVSFHISHIEGREINVACGQMRAHFLEENRK